jgi:hypothetical protein
VVEIQDSQLLAAFDRLDAAVSVFQEATLGLIFAAAHP